MLHGEAFHGRGSEREHEETRELQMVRMHVILTKLESEGQKRSVKVK